MMPLVAGRPFCSSIRSPPDGVVFLPCCCCCGCVDLSPLNEIGVSLTSASLANVVRIVVIGGIWVVVVLALALVVALVAVVVVGG